MTQPALSVERRDSLSILIVEDEAIVARDLQRRLDDLGYDVVASVASSGDAISAAARKRPDVALMDIRIQGDVDGIETAELLRERFQVPVVFLTAYSDSETLARAAHAEPYGYIVKPFTSGDVRSAIEIAHHKHDQEMRAAMRERWFAMTLRSIGDAVIGCDAQQRVCFFNRVAENLTGVTEEEALGAPIEAILSLQNSNGSVDLARSLDYAIHTDGVLAVPPDTRIVHRGGDMSRVVHATVSPIAHEGALLGTVIVLSDVTEEHALREQVALADRMVALGTLAAGVAHEINNPLTYVLGNADYVLGIANGLRERIARSDSHDPEVLRQIDRFLPLLEDVRRGSDRIRQVVADLYMFGQARAEQIQATDVREVVAWALRVSAHETRHRAIVEQELTEVPTVRGNAARLGQVFVNLLVNAAQSIDEGRADLNTIRLSTSVAPDGRVCVTVADTGSGISPQHLRTIFDPFFTTKGPGGGTGLGLAISHRIVREHGGEIRVESTLGKGSAFHVLLPPSARAGTSRKSSQPPELRPAARRARILAIDDEPAVLSVIEAALGDQHDLVLCTDGREALAVLERSADFDLVVCDLMMPNMTGMVLYQHLRDRYPALAERSAFMTGGAFTPAAAQFLATVAKPCLCKPFLIDALLAWIDEALREVATTH